MIKIFGGERSSTSIDKPSTPSGPSTDEGQEFAHPNIVKTIEQMDGLQYQPLYPYGLQDHDQHLMLMHSADQGYIVFLSADINKSLAFSLVQKLKSKDLVFQKKYATSDLIKITREAYIANGAQSTADRSEIERLISKLIEDALNKGSSDLHIEIREHQTDVFVRVYGKRYKQQTLTREMGMAVASVMHDVLAERSSQQGNWSPDIPKDAAINHTRPDGKKVQVRFASAPIYPDKCLQVVCRLLSMDASSAPSFDNLGYTPMQKSLINEMIIGAQGMVLLVGPTNSGKSTTMQALTQAIRQIRGATIKIESIEDPVEYLIGGASQMSVSSRADFESLLKSTLRHDPDVLMVGEVRDRESASTIENMVLAGRKVLSTLHAFEAIAAFQRLIKIGVTEDVLFMNNFLSGIIYQRLLPTLCNHCAIPFDAAVSKGLIGSDIANRVKQAVEIEQGNIHVHNPDGCEHCRDRAPGYKGRTLVAEVLRPDDAMLNLLRDGRVHEVRERWLQSESDTGFGVSAIGHAMMLMMKGVVDPSDVEEQVAILPKKHR